MCTKKGIFALTLLMLLGTAKLLTACHTVAAAGEDVSKAGQAVEKSADKHTP